MRLLACLLLLPPASAAIAQTAAIDIRVTGEHRIAPNDTPDTARELALADAEHKTVLQAVAHLQDRADVKALRLTPNRLDAYVTALLDIHEPTPPPACVERRTSCRATVRVRLDANETAYRLGRLLKDQDASRQLEDTWNQIRNLQKRLPEQNDQLTALRVKRLTTQITVALARTVEAPIGGRAPSKEGRVRARQLADAALALSPDSADAHSAMGDVLIDASELERAEAEYRTAILAHADSASEHSKLGNALLLQSKFTEAQTELREALRLDARSVQAHTDLGLVLRSLKKMPDAVSEYREALRLDPDFVEAHNGLAVTLARSGQLSAAVDEFREIVRIDHDSAIGYYNLAYALADLDRDDESAEALREVVRISPNHYNARYNIGELFRLEGKYDESVTQFREYLRLAPDTPENQRNITRARNFIKTYENE
jgi:tetratricopeptide (TPR) repeat protein